jgi:hypothetical protein
MPLPASVWQRSSISVTNHLFNSRIVCVLYKRQFMYEHCLRYTYSQRMLYSHVLARIFHSTKGEIHQLCIGYLSNPRVMCVIHTTVHVNAAPELWLLYGVSVALCMRASVWCYRNVWYGVWYGEAKWKYSELQLHTRTHTHDYKHFCTCTHVCKHPAV